MEHSHSCYWMASNRQRSLREARERCEEMSADLPIIKSQSENDFIVNLMRWQRNWLWLGMERNNSGFFWFDGSPAEPSQGAQYTYSAWKDNELETWGNESCAFLQRITKKWRNYQCDDVRNAYVLCQKGRE